MKKKQGINVWRILTREIRMKTCDYCGSPEEVKRYYFLTGYEGKHLTYNLSALSYGSYSDICSICKKAISLKIERIRKEIIEEKRKERKAWIKERNEILGGQK